MDFRIVSGLLHSFGSWYQELSEYQYYVAGASGVSTVNVWASPEETNVPHRDCIEYYSILWEFLSVPWWLMSLGDVVC